MEGLPSLGSVRNGINHNRLWLTIVNYQWVGFLGRHLVFKLFYGQKYRLENLLQYLFEAGRISPILGNVEPSDGEVAYVHFEITNVLFSLLFIQYPSPGTMV